MFAQSGNLRNIIPIRFLRLFLHFSIENWQNFTKKFKSFSKLTKRQFWSLPKNWFHVKSEWQKKIQIATPGINHKNLVFFFQYLRCRPNISRCRKAKHDWKWLRMDCNRTSSFVTKCSVWYSWFGVSWSCQWRSSHQRFLVSGKYSDSNLDSPLYSCIKY